MILSFWFKKMNIIKVYSSHKKIKEDKILDITILPCPLYAVNVENVKRNNIFISNYNIIKICNRPYLLSFQGTNGTNYLSNIREKILKFKWPNSCVVQKTENWHFQTDVYGNKNNKIDINVNKCCGRQFLRVGWPRPQYWRPPSLKIDTSKLNNQLNDYNTLMIKSRYSLCPSGTGPNSIRLCESLAFGSIPILLADTLELPHHPLWEVSVLRIQENKLDTIIDLLSKMTSEKEQEMRNNCIKIYNHFKNNYKNN